MIENIRYNTKGLKILTPNGYKDFKGISYNGKKAIWKVALANGCYVEASEDHKFYVNGNPRKLKDLHTGIELISKQGPSNIVTITDTGKVEDTYDVLDVDNENHTFFANDVEVSNCRFLGSAPTLIDADLLEKLGYETQDPIDYKYSSALRIYEQPVEPIRNKTGEIVNPVTYILGVDTAAGAGGDYSAIQVLKIVNEHDIKQVAVYENNTIPYMKFAEAVIAISEYYNNAYIMIENNDVGASVANAIWNDFEYDYIINTDGKGIGTRSTRKSKLVANLLLKRYIESNWIDIVDTRTITQLSMYEEVSPNVYKAPGNEHDDLVTSMLWALYFTTTQYFERNDTGALKISDEVRLRNQKYEDAGLVMFGDEKKTDEDGFSWDY